MDDRSNSGTKGRVLGLFDDEAGLRDHIAANLDLIEPDLELLRTEYPLDNPNGAGGRIDILARDRFDHLVCIEVKRSDRSARETLNELAKYVVLLVERDRVPREMIRCLVISTHWHELLLPLSYFAVSSGVDVSALEATAENGELRLVPKEMTPPRFLPQLSPEMEVIWFDDLGLRDQHLQRIEERSGKLPFVRIALLLLEPEGELPSGRSPYAVVVCVWRVPERFHGEIEAATGEGIGAAWPYFAEGWEAESDAMGWIAEVPRDYAQQTGWNHATSESLRNMLVTYSVKRVVRIGDWPKLEFINDDARILKAVLARSPLGGSERRNQYSFDVKVTPLRVPSWKAAVDAFLDFIRFEPVWRDQAEPFLEALEGRPFDVQLHAFDKKHLFYAIHQARDHPDTMLGFFDIAVTADGLFLAGMVGRYEWDGHTQPANAREAMETIYGDTGWARLSIGSAVDRQRYEEALPLHGFTPIIDVYVSETDLEERGHLTGPGVRAFVEANPDYARDVSDILQAHGPLPTDPAA
jgi:hypothetical protein